MNQQQIRQRTHVSVCRDCTRANVREALCPVGRHLYEDTLEHEKGRPVIYDMDECVDDRPFRANYESEGLAKYAKRAERSLARIGSKHA